MFNCIPKKHFDNYVFDTSAPPPPTTQKRRQSKKKQINRSTSQTFCSILYPVESSPWTKSLLTMLYKLYEVRKTWNTSHCKISCIFRVMQNASWHWGMNVYVTLKLIVLAPDSSNINYHSLSASVMWDVVLKSYKQWWPSIYMQLSPSPCHKTYAFSLSSPLFLHLIPTNVVFSIWCELLHKFHLFSR